MMFSIQDFETLATITKLFEGLPSHERSKYTVDTNVVMLQDCDHEIFLFKTLVEFVSHLKNWLTFSTGIVNSPSNASLAHCKKEVK